VRRTARIDRSLAGVGTWWCTDLSFRPENILGNRARFAGLPSGSDSLPSPLGPTSQNRGRRAWRPLLLASRSSRPNMARIMNMANGAISRTVSRDEAGFAPCITNLHRKGRHESFLMPPTLSSAKIGRSLRIGSNQRGGACQPNHGPRASSLVRSDSLPAARSALLPGAPIRISTHRVPVPFHNWRGTRRRVWHPFPHGERLVQAEITKEEQGNQRDTE